MGSSRMGQQEQQGGTLYRSLADLFLPFLGQRAFECMSYKVDARTSSEIIEFIAGTTRLRLINDREQFFADVAVEAKGRWYPVDDLLELLGRSTSEIDAGINSLPVFAKLLTEHFDAMLAMLRPDKIASTKDAIMALKDARIARMTGKSPRKDQTLH
jgi:hypothetical protein